MIGSSFSASAPGCLVEQAAGQHSARVAAGGVPVLVYGPISWVDSGPVTKPPWRQLRQHRIDTRQNDEPDTKALREGRAWRPAALIFLGEQKQAETRVSLVTFDSQRSAEQPVGTIDECLPLQPPPTTSWINVRGLHDLETIKALGTHFDLHPLILEDILSVKQRPQIE